MARPPRRRAPSPFRIHPLWLLALIAISVILVVIGFARDTRHKSAPTAAHSFLATAGGPWLRARSVGVLPAALQDSAAAPVPGHGAILLGGLDRSDSSTPTLELVGAGPHRSLGALGTPLHDAAAAAVGSSVYLFGGGQISSYNAITQVDPTTGRTQSAGQLPEPRSDLAAATIGHTVYLVGGFTGIKPLNTILAWRPGAKPAKPHVVGALPRPVRYASVAAIGGKLVIAGGMSPTDPTARIETFDPKTGRTASLGTLPAPVSHAPAVALGRYVFVLGGRASNGAPTREIYAIDPQKAKVWIAGHLPAPVSDAAAATFEGGILVAVGHGASGTVGDISYRKPAPMPKSRNITSLLRPGSDPSVLPGNVLIADHRNNRLIQITPQGQVAWSFPHPGALGHRQSFKVPDDAFYTPDGRRIVVTQEDEFVISVIDVKSGHIVYRYGHPGTAGPGANYLWNPDDAMMAPDGRIWAADIKNCRLIELKPPQHHLIGQLGATQVCGHNPPQGFGSPNGAFPTTGGGLVVTEITGDWADVFDHAGHLTSAVNIPGFTYPSDTNEVHPGVYLSVDYTKPGAIETFNAQGKLLWSFSPHGHEALNHPSLAVPLPNGDVLANDDFNDRVIVIDPRTNRIVWQYGHTGVRGKRPGYLFDPDGVDLAPPYSLADRFPDAKGLPGPLAP